MKIIENNMRVSPEARVTCVHCSSIFEVGSGEGEWIKPYSDCHVNQWSVKCPICLCKNYYPQYPPKELGLLERIFGDTSGYAMT